MIDPVKKKQAVALVKAYRKQALMEQSQSSLAKFSEIFLDVRPALHHMMICYEIDRLINGEFDDLVINTPPGSAKSTYASIGAPAYYLSKFPKNTILTASHGFDLAEKWGKRVRAVVTSKKYQQAFEHVRLSQDTRAAAQWATTLGGEFFGVGVGGGVLGRRSDFCVIDDPVSGWEEANSLTRLQKIHDWFETDLMSRLKPGAKIVLICQRLSINDLAGYMIKRNQENPTRRLRVLNIPMECNSEDDPLGS